VPQIEGEVVDETPRRTEILEEEWRGREEEERGKTGGLVDIANIPEETYVYIALGVV